MITKGSLAGLVALITVSGCSTQSDITLSNQEQIPIQQNREDENYGTVLAFEEVYSQRLPATWGIDVDNQRLAGRKHNLHRIYGSLLPQDLEQSLYGATFEECDLGLEKEAGSLFLYTLPGSSLGIFSSSSSENVHDSYFRSQLHSNRIPIDEDSIGSVIALESNKDSLYLLTVESVNNTDVFFSIQKAVDR